MILLTNNNVFLLNRLQNYVLMTKVLIGRMIYDLFVLQKKHLLLNFSLLKYKFGFEKGVVCRLWSGCFIQFLVDCREFRT